MKEMAVVPPHLERMHWQLTEGAIVFGALGMKVASELAVDESIEDRIVMRTMLTDLEAPDATEHITHQVSLALADGVQKSLKKDNNREQWRGSFSDDLLLRVLRNVHPLSSSTELGNRDHGVEQLGQRLEEGLDSGIVGPLNILGPVMSFADLFKPVAGRERVDTALDTLNSNWYRQLMRATATTHNGAAIRVLNRPIGEVEEQITVFEATFRDKYIFPEADESLSLDALTIQLRRGDALPRILQPINNNPEEGFEYTEAARASLLSHIRHGNNLDKHWAGDRDHRSKDITARSSAGCPLLHTRVEFIPGSSMHQSALRVLEAVDMMDHVEEDGHTVDLGESLIGQTVRLVAAKTDRAVKVAAA